MFGDLAPLYSYMRRYRWGYVWGTLACVGTNIVAVQFPRVLGMAIDRIEKSASRELILIFALILVAISLVKGIFLYAQRWILIGISREIEFDLRNDLFRKLETQDSGFYQRYRTGDIMARMTNDLNAVRMLLGPALMYSANTIFLMPSRAKLTLTACPLHPRHPDPLSHLDILDRRTPFQHPADDLVSQDQRLLYDARQLRPVAIGYVQVGMTHAANLNLDQDLVRASFWPSHLLQR